MQLFGVFLQERNSRIFNDRFSAKQVFWDKIRRLSSIWFKAHNFFKRISLSDILLECFTLLMVFSFDSSFANRISSSYIFLYSSLFILIKFFYQKQRKICQFLQVFHCIQAIQYIFYQGIPTQQSLFSLHNIQGTQGDVSC